MLRRAVLSYPILPAPRTAVLNALIRSKGNFRVFAGGWSEDAVRFGAQSIAGRLEQIEELRSIASPTHALIVLRWEWEPGLSLEDRDRLWHAFGVPAFEQVIAANGELLAFECEAHCGLHIASRRFAAGDHEIERSRCACGKTSPRWIERTARPRTAVAGG